MDKLIALVLGGTVPHCELIRQLQHRGYYTILIDYLSDSPARSVADEHIRESTLDQEKVLEIARERNADLVITGCVDQANITACYVMEQLGKYVPYSYETALRVTNKGEMKRIMMENSISTSRYVYVESDDQAVNVDLRYPVMVKPADSNSANGVKKAYNEDEMRRYLGDAIKISRNNRAIIEEFVTGQEISAYCYIKDHKAKLLMTAERLSVLDGNEEVIKCFSSIAPARISTQAKKNAEEIATRIAQAFGLNNTPLFYQGIVNGDRIDVIEFAPRVGGGSCFKTIKGNTGFDIITATIDSWLGNPVCFDTWNEPCHIYVVNTVYGKDGVYKCITGIEDVIKSELAEDVLPIRTTGETINNSRASSSRICFFIVKAENEKEMLNKIKKVYEKIDVVSSTGESLLRTDLSVYALWDKIKID